jgi:hypothetical protein
MTPASTRSTASTTIGWLLGFIAALLMTILPLLSQPNRCVSILANGGSVRFYSILGCLGVAWAMSACAENPSHLNMTYLDRYADPNPTLASILECHGFSCSETSRATLNREAWRRVTAAFVPRARNAQTERHQIAHGVALIQLLVGQ